MIKSRFKIQIYKHWPNVNPSLSRNAPLCITHLNPACSQTQDTRTHTHKAQYNAQKCVKKKKIQFGTIYSRHHTVHNSISWGTGPFLATNTDTKPGITLPAKAGATEHSHLYLRNLPGNPDSVLQTGRNPATYPSWQTVPYHIHFTV